MLINSPKLCISILFIVLPEKPMWDALLNSVQRKLIRSYWITSHSPTGNPELFTRKLYPYKIKIKIKKICQL